MEQKPTVKPDAFSQLSLLTINFLNPIPTTLLQKEEGENIEDCHKYFQTFGNHANFDIVMLLVKQLRLKSSKGLFSLNRREGNKLGFYRIGVGGKFQRCLHFIYSPPGLE